MHREGKEFAGGLCLCWRNSAEVVFFGVCASGDSILTFCVCKRMEQNLTPTDVVPV